MDRTVIVAKEALEMILTCFAKDDVSRTEIRRVFGEAVIHLDRLSDECAVQEHDSVSRWRATEKRTSPCPCVKCDPHEKRIRQQSIREALEEQWDEKEEDEEEAGAETEEVILPAVVQSQPHPVSESLITHIA